MVILVDDEDRENEGDLIMAAEHVRPTDINFMAQHARGLICLTLTKERCEQLNLPLMVRQNNASSFGTNFTLSIEAAKGVTTGISAADRAQTIKAAVAKNATPHDIVQPGHVFPLMAKPGGVLQRAGHTEAGSDLSRLAGLEPAAVIVEILSEDGSMARRPELEKFAEKHDLKIGTIADLIEYRRANEKTIAHQGVCDWPTPYGNFSLYTYQDTIESQVHFAVVKGDLASLQSGVPVITRVQVEEPLKDLLHGNRVHSGSWDMTNALQAIEKAGRGVVVVIQRYERRQQLLEQVGQYIAEDQGNVQPRLADPEPWRNIGIGSQILAELGIHKIQLLSPETRYHALSGFELEITDYIASPEAFKDSL